jgi:hypothetical protein
MRSSSGRGWLFVIVALAAALRLYGLDHGLPFVYNPDEVNIMARSLSVATSPDPGYYLYPSFFFYFVFALMGGLFLAGRVWGSFESLPAFQARFFEDPTPFYYTGRLAMVALALATIVLVDRIVTRHFGTIAGRAAAFFTAVTYFHVRDAHYLKHDVPAAFLVVLAFLVIDQALERDDLRSYLAVGAALGVSFATHYYLVFLAPAFALAHFVRAKRAPFVRLVLAGIVSAVVFASLSPYVLLRFETALEHIRTNRRIVIERSLDSGATVFPSLGLYVDFLAEQGLGYVLLALSIYGFLLIARRGLRALVFWGAFPLFFFAFITYTFFAGRYLNPMLPFLAAASGLAISEVAKRFGRAKAIALALVASAQPLWHSIQVDRLFGRPDTRTLAREWILEQVPDDSAIALQSYSVPVPQSAASFREGLVVNGALSELDRRGKYTHLLEVAEEERKSYRLYYLGKGDERNRVYIGYEDLLEGLEPLRSRGVTYVVLRHAPLEPPSEVTALFRRVEAEGALLAEFSPFRSQPAKPYLDNEDWPAGRGLTHKGPLVSIWSIETP